MKYGRDSQTYSQVDLLFADKLKKEITMQANPKPLTVVVYAKKLFGMTDREIEESNLQELQDKINKALFKQEKIEE